MKAFELIEEVTYGKTLEGKAVAISTLRFQNPQNRQWMHFDQLQGNQLFEFVAWDAQMGPGQMPLGSNYGGYAQNPGSATRIKRWLSKYGWVIPVMAAAVIGGAAGGKYLKGWWEDPDLLDILHDPGARALLQSMAKSKSVGRISTELQSALATAKVDPETVEKIMTFGKAYAEAMGSKKDKDKEETT